MRILVLCKRRYTNKDLLDDRYGRLYELPEELAKLGHDVLGIATNYRHEEARRYRSAAGVDWQSADLSLLHPICWHRRLTTAARKFCPDVIWASSDALHVIIGGRLGAELGVPVIVDLYDNYDAFGMTKLPGVRKRYHDACRKADAVTVVSNTLGDYVRTMIKPRGPVILVQNTVRRDIFKPLDRANARKRMKLPVEGQIIGCAGAIDASRGIDDLFNAFMRLAPSHPNLYLAFAGPRDGTPARYRHPRILDLGQLPWPEVPWFLNALDLVVVCNRSSDFGRYCAPMKLQEAMACGIPVVAAEVGDARVVVTAGVGSTYPPGNVQALYEAISEQLFVPAQADNQKPVNVSGWESIAVTLERSFVGVGEVTNDRG